MTYAPLSENQAEYIKRSARCWLNIAEGGKRAGKNVVNLLAWAACLERHPDRLHLAAGVTEASARLNILDCNGFGLLRLFDGICREERYQNRRALLLNTAFGERIVLICGGGRDGDERRIKGNSYGSAYITEANECHPRFVREVFDRTVSSSERKIFLDLNPKAPEHWFYREIMARHEVLAKADPSYGYNYGHFTMADNNSLSDSRLRDLLLTCDRDDLWFKTDILGQRAGGYGRIYPAFRRVVHAVTPEWIESQRFVCLSVGIDVGGTDATVATLVGFTENFGSAVLIDGYYHKQGKNETHDSGRYAEEIVERVRGWIERFPLPGMTIFAESADKLFRIALKRELARRGLALKVVPAYKKDGILDRVRLHSALINRNRLFVARHLSEWLRAYENAVWDEKRRQLGDWVRLDNGSYPVDCLDSAEYATTAYKGRLL